MVAGERKIIGRRAAVGPGGRQNENPQHLLSVSVGALAALALLRPRRRRTRAVEKHVVLVPRASMARSVTRSEATGRPSGPSGQESEQAGHDAAALRRADKPRFKQITKHPRNPPPPPPPHPHPSPALTKGPKTPPPPPFRLRSPELAEDPAKLNFAKLPVHKAVAGKAHIVGRLGRAEEQLPSPGWSWRTRPGQRPEPALSSRSCSGVEKVRSSGWRSPASAT